MEVANDQLLAAALHIIATEGASALRVRHIADVAGCSTKGLYTQYGGKNGLVEAICIDGFEKLRQRLAADASRTHGLARLRRTATAYRNWALENPTQYQVMFARAVPEYEPTEANRAAGIECFEVLVVATANAGSTGDIHFDDAYRAAMWIWGTIHGNVMLELARMAPLNETMRYDELFEETLDRLLAGMQPAHPTSKAR
jgi:AcrR family transcriptional regulator